MAHVHVNYVFRLRLGYENTEVCMVPAEPPLPSPTMYASKLGDFYTNGRADRISSKGARHEDEASPDLEPIVMATMTTILCGCHGVDDMISFYFDTTKITCAMHAHHRV